MKKQPTLSLLALSLMAMIGLSACQKPAPAEQPVASETAAATAPATTEAHDHDHDDNHEGHEHEEHDHDHEGHDHEGHDHDHHHGGEAYQCGDKKIDLLVHTHDDGEVEAHATIDGIQYDLEADKTAANTYTTDDGLNNQGMKLEINGNEAHFVGIDGKPLLTCQKASS